MDNLKPTQRVGSVKTYFFEKEWQKMQMYLTLSGKKKPEELVKLALDEYFENHKKDVEELEAKMKVAMRRM